MINSSEIVNNKVLIAVPIYKTNINKTEKASLLQLFSILGSYPIFFFTHDNLDISEYTDLLKGQIFNIVYFDKIYFESIRGYNLLLCSKLFYNTFHTFEFMLIYQLDAWVFRDELLEWCSVNYDYIGAPWFKSDNNENTVASQFIGVGNGGFSLRKIRSHLKVLNSFSYIRSPKILIGAWLNEKLTIRSIKDLIANLTIQNNTFHLLNNYCDNEDVFWSEVTKRNFPWFKLPDLKMASKFSLEVNAQKLFKLNHNNLPFGCHAWDKHEPDFWRKFIHY